MNKKCQVFTPQDYVEKILDDVGYISNLYGKKVLENSCGDGNILAKVVERYISDGEANGLSKATIKDGLSKDIVGIEIDKEQSKKCIDRLNSILEQNGITPIEWKIQTADYLKHKMDEYFDFIVGNPPYITYSEMKESDQNYLQEHFESCKKGKFDYCYAFIEKSLNDLSINGKMAYLIPVSIFKTVFGDRVRIMV
jgi:adenine-specific DNA-methyltransferase